MSVLPEHPDLGQARRQAKELLHAARAGDAAALARLAAVSAPLTLAGAQLALARELGQPSWAALVREIEARNASIPENVVRFLRSASTCRSARRPACCMRTPGWRSPGFRPPWCWATLPGSRPSSPRPRRRRPASTRGAAGPRCTWRAPRGSTSTRRGRQASRRSPACCSTPAPNRRKERGEAVLAAAGVRRHKRQLEPQQRADHPPAAGPGRAGAIRDAARVALRRRRHVVPGAADEGRRGRTRAVHGGVGGGGRRGRPGRGGRSCWPPAPTRTRPPRRSPGAPARTDRRRRGNRRAARGRGR